MINLDPGNEELIYECSLDVCDLVNVEDVMEHEGLGPNGAMIFCMEHLKKNIHWLHEKLAGKPKNSYFIFDCPGQVIILYIFWTLWFQKASHQSNQIELYTHNDAVNEIFQHLIKTLKLHLVSILLLDSSHISDTNTYISLLTTTLLSMLRIELPHLAILCKSDLIRHDDLPFNIEYFTQVQDLKQLIHQDVTPLAIVFMSTTFNFI